MKPEDFFPIQAICKERYGVVFQILHSPPELIIAG
jgi:hypothetical protein